MTGTTTMARARRRAGFTLIELIVVMAILATLVAITTAGVQRARVAQQHAVTNQTLTKLQTGLEQQRAAVLDEARDDKNAYLGTMTQFCDNDKDRAKSLLSYAYLRWYFPQTFAEA